MIKPIKKHFVIEVDNNRTIESVKRIAENFNAEVMISNGRIYLINEVKK